MFLLKFLVTIFFSKRAYSIGKGIIYIASTVRLEPTTTRLEVECDIKLRYADFVKYDRSQWDSNPRHPDPKSDTLSN